MLAAKNVRVSDLPIAKYGIFSRTKPFQNFIVNFGVGSAVEGAFASRPDDGLWKPLYVVRMLHGQPTGCHSNTRGPCEFNGRSLTRILYGQMHQDFFADFRFVLRCKDRDIGAKLPSGSFLSEIDLGHGGISIARGYGERSFRVPGTSNGAPRIASRFLHVEPIRVSALAQGHQNENDAEERKERATYRDKHSPSRPLRCFFSGERGAPLGAQISGLVIGVSVAVVLIVIGVWPVTLAPVGRGGRWRRWRLLPLLGGLIVYLGLFWWVSLCGP